MSLKGRFTREQIEDIRLRSIAGEYQTDIAKDYDVSRQFINYIILGTAYKDISPIKKGVSYRHLGERHLQSKLTESDVLEIRRRADKGDETLEEIAKDYNVKATTVSAIIKGKSWSYIGGPISTERKKVPRRCYNSLVSFTAEEVLEIRELYAAGKCTQADLYRKYNVKPVVISNMILGKTYKSVGGPVTRTIPFRKRPPLEDNKIIEIRKLYAESRYTQVELAEKYNIGLVTVGRIVRGEIHKDVGGPLTRTRKRVNRRPSLGREEG